MWFFSCSRRASWGKVKFGDPSSSHSQVIVVTSCLWWIHTKLTSMTLKVGEGDPHTIPSISTDQVWWSKLFSFSSYRGNVIFMMKFTKLTLEVGQDDPYKIPSSFSMRGTYTPNLVIPGQFVPNIVSGKQIILDAHTWTENFYIPLHTPCGGG